MLMNFQLVLSIENKNKQQLCLSIVPTFSMNSGNLSLIKKLLEGHLEK